MERSKGRPRYRWHEQQDGIPFRLPYSWMKLPHLKQWNEKRRQHAALYGGLLKGEENIITPFVRPGTRHTFHIYAIRAKRRNELRQYLLANGIQTLIYYPESLPGLPAYSHLSHTEKIFPWPAPCAMKSSPYQYTLSSRMMKSLTPVKNQRLLQKIGSIKFVS